MSGDHSGHRHATHNDGASGAVRAETRPAEDGGTACQLALDVVLGDGAESGARRAQLERTLRARKGISEAHLRQEGQTTELCVHYDPEQVTLAQVLGLAQAAGAEVGERYKQRTWTIRGMDCPQCALVMEHASARLPGVLSARAAYSTARLVVEYDARSADLREVERRARALGFTLEAVDEKKDGHAHGEGSTWELPLIVASGVFLGAGLLATRSPSVAPWIVRGLFALSALTGGALTARDAVNAIRQRRPDIESLMVLAAIGAAASDAWFEAALLLFLFGLGHALEHRAMERARHAIEALGALRPETARVRRDGDVVEVPVGSVLPGTLVLVRPGDRVPLDGRIREGRSSLDQSAITGESVPVAKGPGDEVFAGTINAEASIEVEVTRKATESALARVVELVAEAESQKSPTQRLTQKIERRVVPIVLAAAPLVGVGYAMAGASPRDAFLRAMAVLVAASPCALAIATPSAVLSAVARAARSGVLIKGGAHLEALGKVSAIAFDKTGTLTEGRPKLVTVRAIAGVAEADLLALAAGAEALSAHPIAKAIVEGAKERGVTPLDASGLEAVHGKGLRATVGGGTVRIGNRAMFAEDELPSEVAEAIDALETAGQTTMIVARADVFLGVLGVADTPRPHAAAVLRSLAAIGIARTVMLSGDNARVAAAVGATVGITETRAPLLPEEKVAAIRELARSGGVAMIGDGVNDAPALAAASVGVAMGGAGSDVALETADVVLMGDDLRRLPFAVNLSRQATRVIRQNLGVSLGVSAVLVVAAVAGWARISHAVVFHEGSTLLVVANALRLLAFRETPRGEQGAA